eukprot:s611_g18.t1
MVERCETLRSKPLEPTIVQTCILMLASLRRAAPLVLDGKESVQEVLPQLEALTSSYSAPAEILAVGQKGTFTAMELLAALRRKGEQRVVPRVRLTKVDTATVEAATKHRQTFRIQGYNHYRLALPSSEKWLDVSALSRWDSAESDKLLVGNNTSVMPLAKAIAGRVKPLPENQVLLVETVLRGDRDQKRLRVSHLANAVARASAWQVRPVDVTKPTRPFDCAVRIRTTGPESPILQVAILPIGAQPQLPDERLQ